MAYEKRQKAVDLSHHLSDTSRARQVSPLKGLQKYMGNPDLIILAGGTPAPSYFPFADISANALAFDNYTLDPPTEKSALSWVWKLFGAGSKDKTSPINIPKYVSDPLNEVNLAVALQYSSALGILPLQKFIKDFTSRVFQPAYADFTTLVHTGNTDGWTRAVLTLCNPGEMILTEEWTYPSAVFSCKPFGISPVPIAMDSEGMRADDLRKTLAEWDATARGAPRPHVMYTVPIGQNPSGATMGEERKKAIYEVCVEFDVIIVEDDPYYFLQEGLYRPKAERDTSPVKHDGPKFLASLAPSYLRCDYQGRVVRLDTFSKYIAPGSRLGWFTCSPLLAERLERQGETSAQAPCGFGQSLVTQLLLTWQYDGFVRWLHGLSVEYRNRRDNLMDVILDEFHIERSIGTKGAWKGLEMYNCSLKTEGMVEKTKSINVFSLVPPTSGMFVWLQMHFESLQSFAPGSEETLEVQLFTKLAEAGVLVAPGWYFAASDDVFDAGHGHFRISFSQASFPDMQRAVKLFGRVVREFYKEL